LPWTRIARSSSGAPVIAGGMIPTLKRVRATRMEVATAINMAIMVAAAVRSVAGAESVMVFPQ
jgi:hypothetical protein